VAQKSFERELASLSLELSSDDRLWYLLKIDVNQDPDSISLIYRAAFVITARSDGNTEMLLRLQEFMKTIDAARLDLNALAASLGGAELFFHAQKPDCSTIQLLVTGQQH